MKQLRSENGRDSGSKGLLKYILQRGIIFENTYPYTPHQNGVDEMTKRIILKKGRTSMYSMYDGTDKFLGGGRFDRREYSKFYAHFSAPVVKKSQHWYGVKHRIDHLNIFGCHSEVYVPNRQRSKLNSHLKCVYISRLYELNQNYRFYNAETGKIAFIGQDKCFSSRRILYVSRIYGKPVYSTHCCLTKALLCILWVGRTEMRIMNNWTKCRPMETMRRMETTSRNPLQYHG